MNKQELSNPVWTVCDVFEDMPLNKAHLEERLAEQCIEHGSWDEAITHFTNASQLIDKAMQLTVMIQAKKCLQLQQDAFLHQLRAVEIRRKEALMPTKKFPDNVGDEEDKETMEMIPPSNQKLEEKNLKTEDKQNIKQATTVDGQEPSDKYLRTKDFHEISPTDANTDREPDSLLQFLPVQPRLLSGRKRFPKVIHDRVEELEIQNQNLMDFVKKLLDEKDKLEKENSQLVKRNIDLHNELEEVKIELKRTLNKTNSVSPPNSPPHFITDATGSPTLHSSQTSCFEFNERLRELDSAMKELDSNPLEQLPEIDPENPHDLELKSIKYEELDVT